MSRGKVLLGITEYKGRFCIIERNITFNEDTIRDFYDTEEEAKRALWGITKRKNQNDRRRF